MLQVRPLSDLVRLGAAVVCLSRWVVLARDDFSRDEFSTSDDDHGVFGQIHLLLRLSIHLVMEGPKGERPTLKLGILTKRLHIT